MGWLFRRLLRWGASVALSAGAAWALGRLREGRRRRHASASGRAGSSGQPSRPGWEQAPVGGPGASPGARTPGGGSEGSAGGAHAEFPPAGAPGEEGRSAG